VRGLTSTIANTIALLSLATIASIVLVRNWTLPEAVELSIRSVAVFSGLVFVPLLLVLSCRTWLKFVRISLPTWRNGLGLASISVLMVTWLLLSSQKLLGQTKPQWFTLGNNDWPGALFTFVGMALLLAISLKGVVRTYVIAAALLLWAWVQASIYT
jgi:hypothetical protein